MTRLHLEEQALQLPAADRLALAEALLESVEGEALELPAWQRMLLDERLAEAARDPGASLSWEEAKPGLREELAAPPALRSPGHCLPRPRTPG